MSNLKRIALILVVTALFASVLFFAVPGRSKIYAATLFSDDFEDGNSNGWTVVNGSWSVVTDGTKVYKQANTSGEAVVYAGTSSWTNYTVEAKIQLYNTASTTASGILARYTDSNNYYMLRLHSYDSKVELYKKVGGTFTKLNEYAMSISTNTWYTLKLVLNGSSLTGYVDGVQRVSATDSSITSGCIGARTYAQSASIDDVLVTDGSSATATPTPTPAPTSTPTPIPMQTSTPTPTPTTTPVGPVSDIIIDNTDSGCTVDSAWTSSTYDSGYYGSNYLHDGTAGADTNSRWAKWTPSIVTAGTYNIYMRWPAAANRADAAPLEIQYNGGLDSSKTVNQTSSGGIWVLIGNYNLSAGNSCYVKILATDAGYTIADAVKFEYGTPVPTSTPTPTPTVNPNATPTPASSGHYTYECENLAYTYHKNIAGCSIVSDAAASGGRYVNIDGRAYTDWISFPVNVPAGFYSVKVGYKTNTSGHYKFQLLIERYPLGFKVDMYDSASIFKEVDLGSVTFSTSGVKEFKIEGRKNGAVDNWDVIFDYIKLGNGGTPPTPIPTATPMATPGTWIYVNQSGYDLNKIKRFTAPNLANGTTFSIQKVGSSTVLFSGTINNNIGDFTGFNPSDPGEYIIYAGGNRSLPFSIGPYWIEKVSYKPALDFLVDIRSRLGATAPYDSWQSTGIAFIDSHQFAYENQTFVAMYFANPSAYEQMEVQTEYVSGLGNLPAPTGTNIPDLIQLINFMTDVTYSRNCNHDLLKEQLAVFLYAYPQLKDYITQSAYNTVRDYTFNLWGNTDKSRYNWYDISHTADLFQTFTVYGSYKGSYPPGHSVMPNLMMYEVAKREGRSDYQSYFNAAYNNAQWMIDNINWPTNYVAAKGQRMSEHITMEGLAYFQKEYPTLAPPGLFSYINSWADAMISRSDNMWDFRKYSPTQWVIPDNYNEPGNVPGFAAAALAACQVLTDTTKKDRLRQIAMAGVDNMFGRNPRNRMYCYDGKSDFLGVDYEWDSQVTGYGSFQKIRGVLDGSPKETAYPFNPGDAAGYSEGWINFNTAWYSALAYMAYEDNEVKVYNSGFTGEITTTTLGSTIGVQLRAPLNFNYDLREKGHVIIETNSGDYEKLEVVENSVKDLYFRGTIATASGAVSQKNGKIEVPLDGWFTISYGYGTFRKQVKFVGDGVDFHRQ